MTEITRASRILAKFGYFVLQAQAVEGRGTVELSGVLENLGTGEKHVFASGDELNRLLRDWGESGKEGAR
jgi:hypothetical protein